VAFMGPQPSVGSLGPASAGSFPLQGDHGGASREHRRAKTDRLDTELLKRASCPTGRLLTAKETTRAMMNASCSFETPRTRVQKQSLRRQLGRRHKEVAPGPPAAFNSYESVLRFWFHSRATVPTIHRVPFSEWEGAYAATRNYMSANATVRADRHRNRCEKPCFDVGTQAYDRMPALRRRA
jgi:hypothetical protein